MIMLSCHKSILSSNQSYLLLNLLINRLNDRLSELRVVRNFFPLVLSFDRSDPILGGVKTNWWLDLVLSFAFLSQMQEGAAKRRTNPVVSEFQEAKSSIYAMSSSAWAFLRYEAIFLEFSSWHFLRLQRIVSHCLSWCYMIGMWQATDERFSNMRLVN